MIPLWKLSYFNSKLVMLACNICIVSTNCNHGSNDTHLSMSTSYRNLVLSSPLLVSAYIITTWTLFLTSCLSLFHHIISLFCSLHTRFCRRVWPATTNVCYVRVNAMIPEWSLVLMFIALWYKLTLSFQYFEGIFKSYSSGRNFFVFLCKFLFHEE